MTVAHVFRNHECSIIMLEEIIYSQYSSLSYRSSAFPLHSCSGHFPRCTDGYTGSAVPFFFISIGQELHSLRFYSFIFFGSITNVNLARTMNPAVPALHSSSVNSFSFLRLEQTRNQARFGDLRRLPGRALSIARAPRRVTGLAARLVPLVRVC